MPAGRPTTYKKEYCEQVIELGRQGKSECQISAALDIPRTTMRSWAERNPEFSSSLMRAKELEQAYWEDRGHDGLDDHKFNGNLWIKSMSARFKGEYTDTKKVNHSGQLSISSILDELDSTTNGVDEQED